MQSKKCGTFWAKIFIAGPKHLAEDICREFVLGGACVTVTETNYIFTHGEQSGVIVELINYPRFPHDCYADITRSAIELAHLLLEGMHQGSFTVQTPDETYWYDRREDE